VDEQTMTGTALAIRNLAFIAIGLACLTALLIVWWRRRR
jgi:LPXTG-motif cell wall-anchored protein